MDVDVAIVGGGAAGLMCAAVAAARGRRVVVLEHAERVGKKILMSGGGRCNFTNLYVEPDRYLSANPHFCKSALARYTQWDFIAMVDRHRIAWHEKELGQLFCDESSKHIVRMLLDECQQAGAQIETSCTVSCIDRSSHSFALTTSIGPINAQRLVIASGGLSIPKMGATGFGYTIARQFGHTLLPTRAGLVPLTLTEPELGAWSDLSGVALPVAASCADQQFRAGMLITHRGFSGPAILQISSYWQPGEFVHLNLLPETPIESLLENEHNARPATELRTVLAEHLPKRLAHRLCEPDRLSGALDNRPLRQYRPAELRAIAQKLQQWPLKPAGTEGYRTAEVTLGGVSVDELSSATMESRLVPGLYFIGEVMDVTGHLGGFNFQWAWASGAAAGRAV